MNASDITLIYEDDNVVVISKPSGMISHPKHDEDTQYSVAEFMRVLTTDKTPLRQGIVHRLDKDTSGVMICAKNVETKEFLQEQFSKRKVKKEYVAVVYGKLEHEQLNIDLPLSRNPKQPSLYKVGANGKKAFTYVETVKKNGHLSLLILKPTTGRTHQIRIHLQYVGNPVVNDPFYARSWEKYGSGRLMLHSKKLEIEIPKLGLTKFESIEPPEFKEMMK